MTKYAIRLGKCYLSRSDGFEMNRITKNIQEAYLTKDIDDATKNADWCGGQVVAIEIKEYLVEYMV